MAGQICQRDQACQQATNVIRQQPTSYILFGQKRMKQRAELEPDGIIKGASIV